MEPTEESNRTPEPAAPGSSPADVRATSEAGAASGSDSEDTRPVVFKYGRRQTDLLPGTVVRENGRYYLRASQLINLNQKAENLGALMDAARSIMAEMDLDSLLQLIMKSVTLVMGADRSTLFLVDADADELWSRVAQGSAEIRVRMGEGIVGHAARTGETVNIPDAYQDERFNPEFDRKSGYHTRSILCMAVKNPIGEIIGAIQVLNKNGEQPFSQNDEELLGAFSSLAGISLANAKAYDDLQKERDSLEVRVQERTKDLNEARKKSDELLLNILPASIADELKQRGSASPRRYDSVTVMFTDFRGFTQVAEKMSPEALIEELDRCFYQFDAIVDRHRLEKIKTIGDSYMCAGGIPTVNRSHAVEAVLAAMEIAKFMEQARVLKLQLGEPFWELRIGIHTGPVVAGVVGQRKFAYDIWGDTVNTASRMESSGEPGRINISASTHDLVKDFFACSYRGKVSAKNKGEIDMYFVDGLLPPLALPDDPFTPGPSFRAALLALQQ